MFSFGFSSTYLAFVEPHLKPTDNIDVPKFNILHRINCRDKRNSEGVLLLGKENSGLSDVPTIETYFGDKGPNDHCLISRWRINDKTVLMLYKSPKFSKPDFLQHLSTRLEQETGDLIVFGDININLRGPEGKQVRLLFSKFKLTSKLNLQDFSTDEGTNIDCCFSNLNGLDAWFYESYYSYHKAICIVWPKVHVNS